MCVRQSAVGVDYVLPEFRPPDFTHRRHFFFFDTQHEVFYRVSQLCFSMDGADNTAEEDPLLSIESSGRTSIPSSASTSSMTVDSDDPERRSFLLADGHDDDTGSRKHLNRTKIEFFGSKRGVWVSHSRLLCLVMVLDLMTLSVQVKFSAARDKG